METGLPNEFHRLMMLAMTMPSLLWLEFLGQQFCADTSLDARDLRFNQPAQSVAVLFVKCINVAFVFNVMHRLAMQFGVSTPYTTA
ncbi:hypothetical protein [Paraburkholderia aspalathi]|uniref:hypothetical protein n=1 Tax=Paraburkholderia aspalathi TaxID=1324617 RepID=UPI0038BC5352